MADLTVETKLNDEWKNVTAALSLAEGSSYSGDIVGALKGATVYQAVTDDTTAPTVTGHPWRPDTSGRVTEGFGWPTRRLTPKTGTTLWLRIDRGECTLVLTEA